MAQKREFPRRKIDAFFSKMDRFGLALSYGDVRLRSDYSEIMPGLVDLRTKFSRNVDLLIPIVSAPMDTVTGAKMAIEMAKLGGLGIIHKGLDPKEQAAAVAKVRYYLNAFIPKPVCVSIDDTLEAVERMRMEKDYNFYSFPVKNGEGKVVGLITKNDFDFCPDKSMRISEIMSSEIISAEEGTNVSEAYAKMLAARKKILPIFGRDGAFKGIYTWSDVLRITLGNLDGYNIDKDGGLQVGAAIGVYDDAYERLELLSKKNIKLVVIDTAHGDSKAVIETLKYCKKNYPDIDVVAGNISEGHSAKRLVDAGADGLRVGQGPGSICTTRVVAGIGRPQVSAVYDCAKATRGSEVPVCADGGIEYSGDIAIGFAAGAHNVMLGKAFAGTKESPGSTIWRNGVPKKVYRGMGSMGAMLDNRTSRERYGQGDKALNKLVPEGVEGEVDYKGELSNIINQLLGGVKAGFSYVGAENIESFHKRSDIFQITNAGLKESHPHGLTNIVDAPNYSRGYIIKN